MKRRKRQALVDTDGRALVLDPQPADVQDRDGAVPVLKQSRRSYPFIVKPFPTRAVPATGRRSATQIAVEIVRKLPAQVGFEVHPRSIGGRAPPRLDQSKQAALEGPGSDHRVRQGLPLRRFRHDAATPER